jgi:hypothetical protein
MGAAAAILLGTPVMVACGDSGVVAGQNLGDTGTDGMSADGAAQTEAGSSDGPASDAGALTQERILFLVDVSAAMLVLDPQNQRAQAVSGVIQKHQGDPNVQFAVVTFSSAVVNVTSGFTHSPDATAISSALAQSANLTDYEGGLAAVEKIIATDATATAAAMRAQTRYVLVVLAGAMPDPLCSAETTDCGPSVKCQPHSHCTPTTVLNASSQPQEQYACNPDYMICTVPRAQWATAFNPPVSPSLYPGLVAGADYNTPALIQQSVQSIVALQSQDKTGSIELNTVLVFNASALMSPAAAPFDLDLVGETALLKQMAQAGGGTYADLSMTPQLPF